MRLTNHQLRLLKSIPSKRIEYLPSEFAEKFRKLTSDVSTIQGRFKYDHTPYLREVVDRLSPYDESRVIGVMKGSQIGFTEGVIVNGILWIIANEPGNILALSANDDLSREMIESRLDQGIASTGIQHLIRPNTIRKRNQRTGDTSKSKEFAGGRLFAGGVNSTDKMSRQRSIRYGFFDDWEAAPMADKDQGDIFSILQKRFSTAKNSMKQYYISTPETKPSNIEKVYLMGDQRKWHVPCPCCGEYIELLWNENGKDGKKHGVIFEKDGDGNLITDSVGYVCQKCNGFFTEKNKYEMNLSGMWVPTAKATRPGYVSYYIPNLVAAPFMYGWTEFAQEWIDIYRTGNEKKSKLKVFFNQTLGLPWEEKQVEIKSNRLAKNVRNYQQRMVPNELSKKDGNGNIVLLTCACDLNGTLDDARLDYEVVGHSESGSIYSIIHGSIGTYQPGLKTDGRDLWSYKNEAPNNVWDYFYNEVINVRYKTDEGNEVSIMITGVDTGFYTHYAFGFIDRFKGVVVGLKGDVSTKLKRVGVDLPKFKPARERPNLYIVVGDLIKDDLAEMIGLQWNQKAGTDQPPGFINFPEPGNGRYDINTYFNQYENEQKVIEEDDDGEAIGWVWKRKSNSAPNHFWDCAVYNLALRDIISQKIMKELGKKYSTWSDFAEVMRNIIEN